VIAAHPAILGLKETGKIFAALQICNQGGDIPDRPAAGTPSGSHVFGHRVIWDQGAAG
jgi:hypothetical protein